MRLGWLMLAPICSVLIVAFDIRGQESLRDQPALEVQQVVPDTIKGNQVIPVEVLIRNVGQKPAEGVVVSGQIPAGFELIDTQPQADRHRDRISWPLGKLSGGESRSLRLRYAVKVGASPTQLDSRFTASFQAIVTSVSQRPLQTAILDLTISGQPRVLVGQPVLLHVKLENRGSIAAEKLVLQTNLGAGLSHPQGSELENDVGALAAGASGTIPLQLQATQAGPARARFRLQTEDGAGVEKTVQIQIDENPFALAVRGPAQLQPDLVGLFQIDVTNRGKEIIDDAQILARIPRGIGFTKASDQGYYDQKSHAISWKLNDWKPGETRTLYWNGNGDQPGELRGDVVLIVNNAIFRQSLFTTQVMTANTDERR